MMVNDSTSLDISPAPNKNLTGTLQQPAVDQLSSLLHRLPASHPAWRVICECLELSAATIGYLIDSTSLYEIRTVQANWATFLATNGDATAQLDGWVDAWWMFWETSHE